MINLNELFELCEKMEIVVIGEGKRYKVDYVNIAKKCLLVKDSEISSRVYYFEDYGKVWKI